MASPKTSLKLLVEKKGSRVLFAEASKEFVDFLFQIFSMPLGTLIEFLGSNQMVGCLGKLKDSIQSFQANCLQPGINTDDIFTPKTGFNANPFLLCYDHIASSEDQSGASKSVVYKCPNAKKSCSCFYINACMCCQSKVALHANAICPKCSCSMNVPMTVVMPDKVAEIAKEEVKNPKGGYVKDVVTYMVMDDLVVKPMSTISSITLINKFGVMDLSQLEEKTVSFGKEEGLKLLAASLKTEKVLTTVFMN